MTPMSGRNRRARRTWIDPCPCACLESGGAASPGASFGPGGSLKTRGSRGRFGAGLVGGLQNPLQLPVDLGRERVGIGKGEQPVHLGPGRLDLVVSFLEELVVGAAVGEFREEHGAGLEAVERLLEPEEVLS